MTVPNPYEPVWLKVSSEWSTFYVPPGYEFYSVSQVDTLNDSFETVWMNPLNSWPLNYDPIVDGGRDDVWILADRWLVVVGPGQITAPGAVMADYNGGNPIWLLKAGSSLPVFLSPISSDPDERVFTEPDINEAFIPLG